MKGSRKSKIEREREKTEREIERERKSGRARIRETDRDRERKRHREREKERERETRNREREKERMRGSKSTSTPLHPFVPFSSSAVVPLTFRQSRHLFLCIGAQKLLPLHFSHWLLCHWCSQTLVPPESLLFHLIRWCDRSRTNTTIATANFFLLLCRWCSERLLRFCCSRDRRWLFGPPWHRQPMHVHVR